MFRDWRLMFLCSMLLQIPRDSAHSRFSVRVLKKLLAIEAALTQTEYGEPLDVPALWKELTNHKS
jgi:hypothetical protein